MQILHHENGSFVLFDVEESLQEILIAIPAATETNGSSAALERFFPKPATETDAPGMSGEWAEYVQPELRELFESAASIVRDDLEQLSEEKKIEIPPPHFDAWLNTLNQARLALATRFEFTEEDLERNLSPIPKSVRELALFQVHFYGFLQECLIREIEE